jgi:predicted ester cyclase
MSPDEIKSRTRRFSEEINKPDWQGAVDLFAADSVPKSAEQFRQEHEVFRKAFPDYHATIEELLVEGNKTVMWLTLRATHQAEFPVEELQGIPPTGTQATWEEVYLLEYNDQGEVVNSRGLIDRLGRLQQLSA